MQTASNLALSVSTESPQISPKGASSKASSEGGFDDAFKVAQSSIEANKTAGSKSTSMQKVDESESKYLQTQSVGETKLSTQDATNHNGTLGASDLEDGELLSEKAGVNEAVKRVGLATAEGGKTLQMDGGEFAVQQDETVLSSHSSLLPVVKDTAQGVVEASVTASEETSPLINSPSLQDSSRFTGKSDVAPVTVGEIQDPASIVTPAAVGAGVVVAKAGAIELPEQGAASAIREALPLQGKEAQLQIENLEASTVLDDPEARVMLNPSSGEEKLAAKSVKELVTNQEMPLLGQQGASVTASSSTQNQLAVSVEDITPEDVLQTAEKPKQKSGNTGLPFMAGAGLSALAGDDSTAAEQSVTVTNSVSQIGDSSLNFSQSPDTTLPSSPLSASNPIVDSGLDIEANTTALSKQTEQGNKTLDTVALSSALLASTKALSNDKTAKGAVGLEASQGAEQASSNLSNDMLLPKEGEAATIATDTESDDLSWVLSQMDKAPKQLAGTSVTAVASAMSEAKPNDQTVTGAPLLSDKFNSEGAKLSAAMALGVSLDADSLAATKSGLESLGEPLATDEVLMDDTIELRKKDQESLLTKVANQAERVGQEVGGMASSVSAPQAAKALSASLATQLTNANNQQNLAMSVPPNHPNWASEMAQKVTWIAREGGHTAHIRLDPPELGSLTVKVSVDSDANTQVSFVAASVQSRDVLESQMHRLREMLAQQGMDLNQVDVDVAERDTSNTQFAEKDQQQGQYAGQVASIEEELEADLIENTSYVSANGVDYYA
ncbi:flagellar hook-length control protein FliK [Marinomonas epiphytica]